MQRVRYSGIARGAPYSLVLALTAEKNELGRWRSKFKWCNSIRIENGVLSKQCLAGIQEA